jgi:hypothetical protein
MERVSYLLFYLDDTHIVSLQILGMYNHCTTVIGIGPTDG